MLQGEVTPNFERSRAAVADALDHQPLERGGAELRFLEGQDLTCML
jgi:hypothetical protein